MRYSIYIYSVMEPTQVQTYHIAPTIILPLPSYHQRGILPDFSSHISNVHRNENPNIKWTYLQTGLYHVSYMCQYLMPQHSILSTDCRSFSFFISNIMNNEIVATITNSDSQQLIHISNPNSPQKHH
jgi:hypothetical protein